MTNQQEGFNTEEFSSLLGEVQEKTKPKPMRWPRELYGNLAKICQKMKEKTNKNISIARLVIFVMTKWVDKNKHLLNKEGKK